MHMCMAVFLCVLLSDCVDFPKLSCFIVCPYFAAGRSPQGDRTAQEMRLKTEVKRNLGGSICKSAESLSAHLDIFMKKQQEKISFLHLAFCVHKHFESLNTDF